MPLLCYAVAVAPDVLLICCDVGAMARRWWVVGVGERVDCLGPDAARPR
jgi:hypothetical protein